MQKLHTPGKLNSVPGYIAFQSRQSILFRLLFCISVCLLLPVALSAQTSTAAQSAQQRTKIILQSSERSRIITKTDITYLRKPVFKHENAILTCDSAVFYTSKNYFEAYDNVHINQADTINIYSDKLNYDGNAKIAHLTERVRMVDKTSVLTTNVLDYDMVSKVGTYVNGGKIVTKDATITSKNGFYFANSRDAYFRYNAVVVTDQSVIKSDTLRYNTLTNWTYFYGPTNIKEKDGGNLYTENGAYNTNTTYAYFGKKNLYTSGSRSLKGDSLYYDGKAGYGKAVRNIVFQDTTDHMMLRGQLGYYYKNDQRTVVTKNAYLGMGTNDSVLVDNIKQPDSLWLGADTLETQMVLQKSLRLLDGPVIKKDNELGEENREGKASLVRQQENSDAEKYAGRTGKESAVLKKPEEETKPKVKEVPTDSLKKITPQHIDTTVIKPVKQLLPSINLAKKKPGIKDSLPVNPMDTMRTRAIKAFHNVRVYKSNMQAKADSLFYTAADSTLRWYKNPIIWSQSSQQTGDTIYVQLRNKKINSIQILQNAFAVNVEPDTAKFNQVKGKLITGFFKDGKLNSMYVDGNAESVYFTKTDDGKKYDKMNQTISSRIKVIFRDSEIQDVVPIKDVEGATTPVEDLKEDVILTGFIWKPELRPRSKKDIVNFKPPAKPKPAAKSKTKGLPGAIKAKETGLKQLQPKQVPSANAVKKAAVTLLPVVKPVTDSLLKKTDEIKKAADIAAPLVKPVADSVLKKLK
ncbi:OstA-like protein [Pedobacter antarcticus]|uniref:OstA-like protein n=1 Tax=Pedobacter antarcticus TaxID=34086 RepID=UPI0008821A1C|nr:OstA-like protein [Pedobacter antarcticus]SDM01537.1 OstA-like protein [Pedobacter antarcticus]